MNFELYENNYIYSIHPYIANYILPNNRFYNSYDNDYNLQVLLKYIIIIVINIIYIYIQFKDIKTLHLK